MRSPRSMLRHAPGWIGAATAAVVVVAGAAVGAQASSSRSAAPAGSSSATDPHETAAQNEADRILTTFQPPPGASRDSHQPDPLPSGLRQAPERSAATTQAVSLAWYSTTESADQVLAWVRAHPPTGSSMAGAGSGSVGPSFVSYQYGGSDDSLIITPESDSSGHTVIRLDAVALWRPSRNPDTQVGSTAPFVTVVTTDPLNPHNGLPAAETTPVTSHDQTIVHQVVGLLNALKPPIPGTRNCAMDDGTRVLITLPGLETASADPGGCGEVTITPQGGGAPQSYDGGPELIAQVYALFGITWSRS